MPPASTHLLSAASSRSQGLLVAAMMVIRQSSAPLDWIPSMKDRNCGQRTAVSTVIKCRTFADCSAYGDAAVIPSMEEKECGQSTATIT